MREKLDVEAFFSQAIFVCVDKRLASLLSVEDYALVSELLRLGTGAAYFLLRRCVFNNTVRLLGSGSDGGSVAHGGGNGGH